MNIGNKISVIAAILQEDLEEYRSLIPYLKEEVVEAVNSSLVKLKPVIDSLLTERVEEMVESLAKAARDNMSRDTGAASTPVLTVESYSPCCFTVRGKWINRSGG